MSMDAKIKWMEVVWGTGYSDSKYLPHRLWICSRKTGTSQWRNLTHKTQIKWSKVAAPVMKCDIMSHRLRWNQKNPVSLLWCSCPESNDEETCDKINLRRIPRISWPMIFKCQGFKSQEKTEGIFQIEGYLRDVSTKGALCIWVDLFFYKGH